MGNVVAQGQALYVLASSHHNAAGNTDALISAQVLQRKRLLESERGRVIALYGYQHRSLSGSDPGWDNALMYYATSIDPSLRPTESYKAMVIAGAREHGLPTEYVLRLQSMQANADPPDGAATDAEVRAGPSQTQ